MLLLSAGLLVYSRVDDHLAGLRAQRIVEQIMAGGWDIQIVEEPQRRPAILSPSVAALVNENDSHHDEMPGRQVIGVLEIPALNLALPVLHASTYALLDISVARYTGGVTDRPERLVIAGHNYDSHFGRISSLKPGDQIRFTTTEGVQLYYRMLRLESCHMTESEVVQEGADWDITLLTCQNDRTMRSLVRFAEIHNN